MERPRAVILTATIELVAEGGVRAVTMAAVARRARVAKATVYNHFRDREELLRAALQQQWQLLEAECADRPRPERWHAAVHRVSGSSALDGLRRHDPAVLVHLVATAVDDPRVRVAVADWLDDDSDVERAVRWLASFAVAPTSSAEPPL